MSILFTSLFSEDRNKNEIIHLESKKKKEESISFQDLLPPSLCKKQTDNTVESSFFSSSSYEQQAKEILLKDNPVPKYYMNLFALHPESFVQNTKQFTLYYQATLKLFVGGTGTETTSTSLLPEDVLLYWKYWTPTQKFLWMYIQYEMTEWKLSSKLERKGKHTTRHFILEQITTQELKCLPLLRLLLGMTTEINQLQLDLL